MFLKRLIAFLIDLLVISVVPLTFFLIATPETVLMGDASLGELEASRRSISSNSYLIAVIWFVVVNGTLTGLLGYTPGKLFLNIRVATVKGQPIGIVRGILREAIKLVCMGMLGTGAYFAVLGILNKDRTFYDQAMNTNVYDINR